MLVTLQNDEPLFNLRKGDEIKVDLDSSFYGHGTLVIAFDGEPSPSVHRIERLSGKIKFWPPLKNKPWFDRDVIAGPITSINGQIFEQGPNTSESKVAL
jgi:hypothetical protein